MKHALLSTIAILGLGALGASAQTYIPAAGSALGTGTLGVAGYSQTINFALAGTVTVTGQQILDALPAGAGAAVGGAIVATDTYELTGVSTVLTVNGLPADLSDDCGGCTVNGGSSVDIIITGTPSVAGSFTVDITSETSGNITISGFDVPFGGQLDLEIPGLPPVDIPTMPDAVNGEGYTLFVNGLNGIEESNEVFSLGLYPNPTEGISTLAVNSTIAGMASIEVYSITGSLVMTSSTVIRVGSNNLSLNLEAVPSGIYLVKADINGSAALIRVQRK